MVTMRRLDRLSTAMLAALVFVVAVALLGQTGSVPHSHGGTTPGLFNEEHDLTLLAASGAAALPEATDVGFATVLIARLAAHAAPRPIAAPCRGADCRAPPVA